MKIFGVLEVHRLRRHPDSGHRELPWDDLIRDLSPAARGVVARLARSEVKNYLAGLAEQAEVPFGDPAEFVRGTRVQAARAKGLVPCSCPDCPDLNGDCPHALKRCGCD